MAIKHECSDKEEYGYRLNREDGSRAVNARRLKDHPEKCIQKVALEQNL